MEQALYGVIFLPPSGPRCIVATSDVPFFRESQAVQCGEKRVQEVSLSSCEGMVSVGKRKGPNGRAPADRPALLFGKVGLPKWVVR